MEDFYEDRNRSCDFTDIFLYFPQNGELVFKLRLRALELFLQGSMSWSVVRLCGVLFGDMGSQAARAEFPPVSHRFLYVD